MGCLGNIIWFLCGGLWQGICWFFSGVIWCITIIGFPIGKQCFKFASLAFFRLEKKLNMEVEQYPFLLILYGLLSAVFHLPYPQS